jgi:hypothetical protein
LCGLIGRRDEPQTAARALRVKLPVAPRAGTPPGRVPALYLDGAILSVTFDPDTDICDGTKPSRFQVLPRVSVVSAAR